MVDLTKSSRSLERTAEGYWRSTATSAVSYPEWGNAACFEVEESSFWFRHRNACILEAIRRYPPPGPLFDVGGGNGFVAKAVQDGGFEVVLVEPGIAGVVNARKRGIQHVICATLDDAGFYPASLPAIGLFDVVEHIDDDCRFLNALRIHLLPHGRVFLTVPAYQGLWSSADINAGHRRRYSNRGLTELLSNAGFEVEFLTGFFFFLLPAILVARVIPHLLGRGASQDAQGVIRKMRREHEIKGGFVSKFLKWSQDYEVARIRRGRRMGFGASWLAVARKAP